MSARIPPEWFRSIVLEATFWNARERHIDRLWYVLSKPSIQAKFLETKTLIEALNFYGNEDNYDREGQLCEYHYREGEKDWFDYNTDNGYKARKALKPFQEGE